MNLVVTGSRTWDNEELLFKTLTEFTANIDLKKLVLYVGDNKGTKNKKGDVITRGADKLAMEWANKNYVPMRVFHADWDKHDKAAGPIRNKEMLKEAGENCRVIAFRMPGESRGTDDTIKQAKQMGLKVKLVEVSKNAG